ncbi:lysozyme [Telmatobacter bradus]|uniref:lysozyme n=1 Tax=Telmatobacter bradus TaxID=474953 RepID=UPI003B431096
MDQMQYSQSGLHLTEQFEGCKLSAYPDSNNVPTIGYGHTKGVQLGMVCTQTQAGAWLDEDVAWAGSEVNRLVTVPLTQPEFDALVDFTFNCGCGNFDHSHLLALVNQGDMQAAAQEFDKWDKCGGQVMAGLLRRREAEQSEFDSSADPSELATVGQ